jgi:GNAT superfamily N-acetyltransferase
LAAPKRTDESVDPVFDAVPAISTFLSLSPRTLIRKLRTRGWSTRRSLLVVCDLTQPPAGPALAPGLDVSFVEPAAFRDLPSTLRDAHNQDALTLCAMERTRALAAGELVVARSGDELAGIHFIHTRAHQQRLDRISPSLYSPLREDEVLSEAVFVYPKFRGRGVGSSMLRASASELARRGYRRSLAVIDVENRASLRAFRTAGFTAGQLMRVDSYRLGRRTSRFRDVDDETRQRYLEATSGADPAGVSSPD